MYSVDVLLTPDDREIVKRGLNLDPKDEATVKISKIFISAFIKFYYFLP